jgi:hypothetical protein
VRTNQQVHAATKLCQHSYHQQWAFFSAEANQLTGLLRLHGLTVPLQNLQHSRTTAAPTAQPKVASCMYLVFNPALLAPSGSTHTRSRASQQAEMQALRGLASSFRIPLAARRRSQRCAPPPSAARRSQHKRANSIVHVAQSTALNCNTAAVPGLHACAPEPRSSTQELIERILAENEPKTYDW